MSKPQQAPTVYRGHVVSVTFPLGKRVVKVKVDDAGPHYRKAFWVDQNNTPEWLGPGMAVMFWLVPIGTPSGSNRMRVAINVVPQE